MVLPLLQRLLPWPLDKIDMRPPIPPLPLANLLAFVKPAQHPHKHAKSSSIADDMTKAHAEDRALPSRGVGQMRELEAEESARRAGGGGIELRGVYGVDVGV